MPLDQVMVGSVATGVLALLSQAISACNCHTVCARDESDEYGEPSCACGFLDAPLFKTTVNDKETSDQSEPT